jgi:hypothetical protein
VKARGFGYTARGSINATCFTSNERARPNPLRAALRTPFVVALLFFEHGLSRMFAFPSPLLTLALLSQY